MTDVLVSITISYVGESVGQSAGELDVEEVPQRECLLLARLIVGLDGQGSCTWRVRCWLQQRPKIKVVVALLLEIDFRPAILIQ
jgi:hypothetical protein